MRLEPRSVADLLADPRNTRVHDDRNIEVIRGSLRLFGQQKNIVIMPDGVVIAGSGTLQAARDEGWDTLDCKVWTGSMEEARAYGIVDNRSAELAAWDKSVLVQTWNDMPDELTPYLGFTGEEIAAMVAADDGDPHDSGASDSYEGRWEVVVECKDADDQRTVYEALSAEGRTCRVLTL